MPFTSLGPEFPSAARPQEDEDHRDLHRVDALRYALLSEVVYPRLTGRTRYASKTIARMFRTEQLVLLQVEEQDRSNDGEAIVTIWRNATPDDMFVLLNTIPVRIP